MPTNPFPDAEPLHPKRWRRKPDGRYFCDGDCRSWDFGVCTCGLYHHLRFIEGGGALDGMSRKIRAQGYRTDDYLLREKPVPRPETCDHGTDMDAEGGCEECRADTERILADLDKRFPQ